jgi:hypothetical protein
MQSGAHSGGKPAAGTALARGEIDIDHVAHFVPDIDAAARQLEALGFTATPLSVQSHRLKPGGPLVPAGTANRCVMLEQGYVEFLTATAPTSHADQLRAQLDRYTGVHLIAFGTAAPELDHDRLARSGFDPAPPVALERPIDAAHQQATARFTVVRVPAGRMAEGRIQFCRHETPELLWQPRWTTHPNGAIALVGVIACVADAAEAAARYGRFTGLDFRRSGATFVIRTARGTLTFIEPVALEQLHVRAPALPWIAGYALETRDLAAAGSRSREAGCTVRELGSERLLVELPPALGGLVVFQRPDAPPLLF